MFKGSIPALVTPMRQDGAIDFGAWDRLLDFHLDAGSDAVVVGGTTGESPALERAELEDLVRSARRRLAGRIPLIAGSGSNESTNPQAQEHRLFTTVHGKSECDSRGKRRCASLQDQSQNNAGEVTYFCDCPGNVYHGKCWHINGDDKFTEPPYSGPYDVMESETLPLEPWVEWAEEAALMEKNNDK